jgi:hypothetical protein
LLSRLDDREASFGETLGELCRDVFKEETYVIGFDDGTVERGAGRTGGGGGILFAVSI